jgi:hypothetical protein
MKVLLATMIAAVCALTTAGGVNAPLLDIERTDTNVIVAVTPPAPLGSAAVESSTATISVGGTPPADAGG